MGNIKITPSMKAVGYVSEKGTYLIRQYDEKNNILSDRDFWLFASSLPDFMDDNPEDRFLFDPNDWISHHYERIFRMINSKKNLDIV